ncbi:MAG: MFS transporter [Pseudomonadales bacterium]|nr:MFS transporter [Pseudomonadales bacterium]
MSEIKRVSEARILSYGSLYLPVSMALLPVNLYVLPFYAELGIPLYAMSAIIFAARLSDAVTDPLMGIITDRTRSPWGRRKPWILFGTPLLMISIYKLFMPPAEPTVWYFGTWIILLYLAYTIVSLPYYAWGAEMSDDYSQRTHISGRREQFHFAGNVSFNLLPLLAALWIYLDNSSGDISVMIANFSAEFQQIMKARAGNIGVILGWLTIFVMVAIPLTTALALYFAPEPRKAEAPGERVGFFASLRVIKRNGPYLRIVFTYVVTTFGIALVAAGSYFFVKHVVKAGELYPIYVLVYYSASVIGVSPWMAVCRRLGKHQTFNICVAWYALWACVLPFVPEGNFGLFLIIMTLKGCSVAAMPTLAASMAADTVDIDFARTGEHRAGLYFAIWGFLRKGAYALGGAAALAAFAFVGFDPTADVALAGTPAGNSDSSLFWLTMLYTVIPAIIHCAALPVMWNYPLTEARHTRLTERLARRAKRMQLQTQA